ncbi:MAG: type II toxin-antitoxin system Phd/YefM family antitoxin [Acidimicrobiales bacterium]
MGVRRISHRELRNNSSRVLRDVVSGEIIEVTNNGELAAVLVPPVLTSYERLVAAGKVRLPEDTREVDLRHLARSRSTMTSADIIGGVRGDV